MDHPSSRRYRFFLFLANAFTIILLISLLLLFLAAARPRALAPRGEPIGYTLRLSPLPEEYAAELSVGDTVLDAVGKREIGSVSAVSVTPAMTEVFDRTARTRRRVAYPGYVTVTLEISAEAVRRDGTLTVAGFPIYRGDNIPLRFPHLTAHGVCTAIVVTP